MGLLSALLFQPVMLLLLALSIWMLLATGRFFRQLASQMRGKRPALVRHTAAINEAVVHAPVGNADLAIEAAVQQAEREVAAQLRSVRFAVRAGPSLGLMGTLIPMATALGGLASGDLPGLAANMSVAFSSTVIGIAIGLLAYVITLVQEGWYNRDLDAIRLYAEETLRASEVRTASEDKA